MVVYFPTVEPLLDTCFHIMRYEYLYTRRLGGWLLTRLLTSDVETNENWMRHECLAWL